MSVPLKILIIEDSASDADLIIRNIERGGYQVKSLRVEDAEALRHALQSAAWDLVISDNNLPGFDARAAFGIFKSAGLNIPFIIISQEMGDEAAVALMKAGVQDYLLKSKLVRLIPVIERELAEAEQRRIAREQEKEIQSLSRKLIEIAEHERAYISGELHDSIGQSLVLLKLNIIRFLEQNTLRSEENERLLLQPIDETLRKVREISRNLTPSHMRKVGLAMAVEDMLQSGARLSGLSVSWDLQPLEGFFPENWNIQVFRIIQEAFTNALKHARASAISVITRCTDAKYLEISIADNGQGFSAADDRFTLGLTIMRERVRGLGGTIRFEPANPGVLVQVVIPPQ